jgi:hypothetical protein
MSLLDHLRKRRQLKARKRYEREKTRQEVASDPNAMDRAAQAGKTAGGGLNPP